MMPQSEPTILDDDRVGRERKLRRWIERLAGSEIEAGEVQRAGERGGRLAVGTGRAPAGQEALVQLEVLVGADALEGADHAVGVDHHDLTRFQLAERFPLAMEFVRPGFDEPAVAAGAQTRLPPCAPRDLPAAR